MKLYYSKGACSLAVRIVLHELNINFDAEAVNLGTKKTASGQDFLAINPKGAVPALVLDNEQVLTENTVIQQYLADHFNGNHLLPAMGDIKRYRVLEWLNFVSTDLHKGCSPLFNAKLAEEIKDSIFRPALVNKLKYAEQQLAQHDYLLGNKFSLADAYLFVINRWLPHLGIDVNPFPALMRYQQRLKQRNAIQQALQEEGLA